MHEPAIFELVGVPSGVGTAGERARSPFEQAIGVVLAAYALAASVVLAGAMGLVLVLPFVVVPRGRRERYTMPPARWWAGLVIDRVLGVRTRVRGSLELGEHEGALVLSNHRSWLDPLLLMRHLRSNGLSKRMILWIPFVGLMGWLSGAVFFDRENKRDRARARQEVLDLVRAGHRIQVFPEGTRTREGLVGKRIYLNLAMDCFKEGIPVVCCAVWRTEDVLPVGVFQAWYGREVDLVVGRTLRPADFPDARRFAQACWDEVVGHVERLSRAGADPA